MLLFGAFSTITISPFHVWVRLKLTDMAEILHVVGIPLTLMVCEAPVVEASGTATLIAPEGNDTDVLLDVELVSLTAGSPRHIVTDDGVMFGAGGV